MIPEWIEFWRNAFPGVLPGYHLNKKYWNTILLDGTVPDPDIKRMIGESFELTEKKREEADPPFVFSFLVAGGVSLSLTPSPPGIRGGGKDIAEGKGVHREVESEGSWIWGTY